MKQELNLFKEMVKMAQFGMSMNETDKIHEARKHLFNEHGEDAIKKITDFRDKIARMTPQGQTKSMMVAIHYEGKNDPQWSKEDWYLATANLTPFTKENRQKWINEVREKVVQT